MDDLSRAKKAELTAFASEHGLSTSGTREVLEQRIRHHLNETGAHRNSESPSSSRTSRASRYTTRAEASPTSRRTTQRTDDAETTPRRRGRPQKSMGEEVERVSEFTSEAVEKGREIVEEGVERAKEESQPLIQKVQDNLLSIFKSVKSTSQAVESEAAEVAAESTKSARRSRASRHSPPRTDAEKHLLSNPEDEETEAKYPAIVSILNTVSSVKAFAEETEEQALAAVQPAVGPLVQKVQSNVAEVGAVVDKWIEDAKDYIGIGQGWQGVKDRAAAAQEKMSSASSIVLAMLFYEIIAFFRVSLPYDYHIVLGPTPLLKNITKSQTLDIYLPDIYLLITREFWAFLFVYVSFFVAIPALFAYWINPDLLAHDAKHRDKYRNFSALSFCVARVVMLIISQMGVRQSEGWLGWSSGNWGIVQQVMEMIGKGSLGVGSVVSGIFAIVEAVVQS